MVAGDAFGVGSSPQKSLLSLAVRVSMCFSSGLQIDF